MRKLNVLIAGSTGYIGIQLVKLLVNHKNIKIKYLCGSSSVGKNIEFPKEVTGLDIAEKISKSLSKQALIMSVDGELKDLYFSIKKDCSVKIFTAKDPEGLEVIRHDTAHIMAMAVQELYPGTQVTIGPVIENGFYYDFARKEPFTADDLKKIEKKMADLNAHDVDEAAKIIAGSARSMGIEVVE